MLFAKRGNTTVRAEPGARASCPGCEAAMIAKCGPQIIWHWAHEADRAECDTWSEGESAWHLGWKLRAVQAGCRVEVTFRDGQDWHRADIVRPDGTIVELQHSSLDAEQIARRESFYRRHGGLLWVWDARERWAKWLTHRRGDPPERYYTRQFSSALVQVAEPMIWELADDDDPFEYDYSAKHRASGLVWIRKTWVRDFDIQCDVTPAFDEDVFEAPSAAAAEAWRYQPMRCASCGAEPVSTYRDGSPKYDCYDPATHHPIRPASGQAASLRGAA